MAQTEKEIQQVENEKSKKDQVENDSIELTEADLEKVAGAGDPPPPSDPAN